LEEMRMLLLLISRCMRIGLQPVCKYSKPVQISCVHNILRICSLCEQSGRLLNSKSAKTLAKKITYTQMLAFYKDIALKGGGLLNSM
jgi:hypothetical protein